MIAFALAVILLPGAVVNGLRWLRVAQREHYLPGTTAKFAWRWRWHAAGLGVRGRTSKLAWTRRMKLLAAVAGVLQVVLIVAIGLLTHSWPIALIVGVILVPAVIDAALAVTKPIESQLAKPFVNQAAAKLRAIHPTVVAITGSYGKTSTKVLLAHLVQGTRTVSASPASFNNRAGLARAINEGLAPGTDVFVAEMGTYGKGEIAELCAWCPPDIAVITAIGPVHLERMKSEDNIVAAKSEIFANAKTVVLNVDDPRLAALADTITDKTVIRASASQLDFPLDHLPTAPTNVACAIAVALELGVSRHDVLARLKTAPSAAHRLVATTAPSGVVVLDDTFNSNPAGARRALAALADAGTGRKVLITPGMIELGPRQATENEALAADASKVADVIGVVGKTNRPALTRGATTKVELFANRAAAVEWVRANLGPGDAVLYENDLPDHYR